MPGLALSSQKPKGRDNKNQGQGQCPRQGACPGPSPAPIAGCVCDWCNKFPQNWQWIELHPARPAHGPVGCTKGHWQLAVIGASDPKTNKLLLEHCEGLRKYHDKLNFPLPQKLDNTGSGKTANETHASASVEYGLEGGLMEGYMVANKIS